MQTFADKLHERILKVGSVLCAGFDPTPAQIPAFLDQNNPLRFGELFLDAVAELAACVKFNAAFFEAFGLAGLQTLQTLTQRARKIGLPVVIDAKRGDIGNTAAAYSAAWLGADATCAAGDALTVNPYLGFDTLEPFIKRCKETGSGLFVLVRTSNPGASQMQDTVSDAVARFLNERAQDLVGNCGRSGLGAVVGATDPAYQLVARKLMPKNLFLVPGYGAQGASAAEAMSGLGAQKTAGVVNSSRGLVEGSGAAKTESELVALITNNTKLSRDALGTRSATSQS